MKHHPETSREDSLIKSIRLMLKHLSPRRRYQLVLLTILMLLSSVSEMASLGAIFQFLEGLSNSEAMLNNPNWELPLDLLGIQTTQKFITFTATIFIATVVIANSLRILTINAQIRLSAAIGIDLSCDIYKKTLQQPYSFHTRHNSSDLIQTLIDDTNLLTTNILRPLLTLLTDSWLAIFIMGTIIFINPYVAVATAILLGGTYTVIYRFRQKLLKRNSKIITQAGQRRIKAAQEGLGGIRDVLISNTQDFFVADYQKAEKVLKRTQATNALLAKIPLFIVEVIAMTSIASLALIMGRNGDFSQVVPVLGSLTLGAKKLLPSLYSVFASIATIQGSRSSLDRVVQALERNAHPSLNSRNLKPLSLDKELRLEKVWFRYNQDGDWILRDLSLSIEAKTTVAFVGGTGSGKSTTADIILGLLQPQKGTFLVDNVPLSDEKRFQWQQSIGHVPQSIFLTDASIAENIAFAVPREEIDFEQVRKAAKLAQIDEFINTLPSGYETYVGERGVRLSGGQRQRIGIARALYRQVSVIVFDEATSALDNATEKEVMAAINSLSSQFTVILIAHRLSTVERCNTIFEISHGQLVAQGKYSELVAKSSTFQKMLSSNRV